MSAALHLKEVESPVNHDLAEAPSKLRAELSRLGKAEEAILAKLPSMPDSELDRTRRDAERLGTHSWRIVCACDAEIWNRTERLRGGRGVKDNDKVGIMSAVRSRAEQLGCKPKTIMLNRNIHATFGETMNRTVHSLPEKEFYKIALKTPEPLKTLDRFLKEKETNPKFNTALAEKVRKSIKSSTGVAMTPLDLVVSAELLAHIEEVLPYFRKFYSSCPVKSFARRTYHDLIENLEDHIRAAKMNDEDKLRQAWAKGYRKENEMSKQTGLGRDKVKSVMQSLSARGEFYIIEQQGETDMAKGGHAKLWWKTSDMANAPRINR